MEKLKKLLDRLLFPGTAVVVLSVPVAAALLAYTFLVAGEDSPIAYPSYVFSAYSLMIVCASAVPLFQAGKRWAMQNRYVKRYLKDIPFKTSLSLHLSLAVNLLYAGMNGFSGFFLPLGLVCNAGGVLSVSGGDALSAGPPRAPAPFWKGQGGGVEALSAVRHHPGDDECGAGRGLSLIHI